ncbi:hypothetical protein BJY52DRAFT_1352088 [Lactarius psammicola]|nr:hypothetical protein BJY52DRAFT_1352088 [Lactarius psammicola]
MSRSKPGKGQHLSLGQRPNFIAKQTIQKMVMEPLSRARQWGIGTRSTSSSSSFHILRRKAPLHREPKVGTPSSKEQSQPKRSMVHAYCVNPSDTRLWRVCNGMWPQMDTRCSAGKSKWTYVTVKPWMKVWTRSNCQDFKLFDRGPRRTANIGLSDRGVGAIRETPPGEPPVPNINAYSLIWYLWDTEAKVNGSTHWECKRGNQTTDYWESVAPVFTQDGQPEKTRRAVMTDMILRTANIGMVRMIARERRLQNKNTNHDDVDLRCQRYYERALRMIDARKDTTRPSGLHFFAPIMISLLILFPNDADKSTYIPKCNYSV